MTGHPNDHRSRIEEELHDAVQAYGASVQPADRLGEIRRSLRPGPRAVWRRPWLMTTGAGLVTATIVVGALVLIGPGSGSGPTTPKPPAEAAVQRLVTVYDAREVGDRLWLYPERVDTVSTDDAAYDAVLALLGGGPVLGAGDRWVGCPLGQLESVEVRNHVVTLSMSGPVTTCDMDPRFAQASMQQLAWTVHDAVGGDSSVVVENEGRPVIPQPVTADPNALSPVLLERPSDGGTVSSPVTVQGRGNTFEGNVQWQVLSGDRVVEEGFETAGTLGAYRPFWFTVDLPPGDYTARAFATSAEDGSLFAEDTLTFTVD